MDKYYELDNDEQTILDQFEKGELQNVLDVQARIAELQKYAKASLNKTKNISIRLSERDLYRLRAKAIEEGIPYQTLAASILHKATA
jgi:predicted DNA binding CopG/RHH family protein